MPATPQDRAVECVFLIYGRVVRGRATWSAQPTSSNRASVDSETPYATSTSDEGKNNPSYKL
jgi:hypothetical protein